MRKLLARMFGYGYFAVEYTVEDAQAFNVTRRPLTALYGSGAYGAVHGVFRSRKAACQFRDAMAKLFRNEYPILPTVVVQLDHDDPRVLRYKENK